MHTFMRGWARRAANGLKTRPVMKSLRIIVRGLGGPEVLETIEEDAPEPGPGELRVRVLAAGVSFAEMLMREGIHPENNGCILEIQC